MTNYFSIVCNVLIIVSVLIFYAFMMCMAAPEYFDSVINTVLLAYERIKNKK